MSALFIIVSQHSLTSVNKEIDVLISRSKVAGPKQVPHWEDNWVGQEN